MEKIRNKILGLIYKLDPYIMRLWNKYPIGMVKRQVSILKIEKACEITDEIFENIISNFTFKTENELKDFILAELKKRKLSWSFPPIVVSDIRAGNEIHPFPTDGKLSRFTIIDFGLRYRGFCSDMTRTIFVGNPTEEDHMLYKKILDAEMLGIKIATIGKPCNALDKEVRDSLGEYAKYFIHTLGHGIGRMVHEPPRIYYKFPEHVLKENMVITIEPGIYIKYKLGIRIEDTCHITKQGCIPLTKSPKELIVVK